MPLPLDLPAMSFKSRENGEMQDMYRRTLASTWAAQAGELPADECIEDIFAGGSGWGDRDEPNHSANPRTRRDRSRVDGDRDDSEGSNSDHAPRRPTPGLEKGKSDGSAQQSTSNTARSRSSHRRNDHQRGNNDKEESGSSSQHSNTGLGFPSRQERRTSGKHANEVDEFEVREDLRSWRLPMTG